MNMSCRQQRKEHLPIARARRIGAEALVRAELITFQHVLAEPPILLVVADRVTLHLAETAVAQQAREARRFGKPVNGSR